MTKGKTPRRLNWLLVGGLLGVVLVVAVVVRFVHDWQLSRLSESIRAQVALAEQEGRPGDAIAAIERYLALKPDDQEFLARLGRLLDSVADTPVGWARTLVVKEKVLRKDLANHELRRRIAELAMQLDFLELAEIRLEELRNDLAEDSDVRVQLGDVLLRRGQVAKAVAAYKESLQVEPEQTAAYVRLARVYQSIQKPANPALARTFLDQMVAAQPGQGEPYLARGRFLQSLGQLDEAAVDFAEARRLAPDEAEPVLAAAELAALRRRYDEAEKLLEEGRRAHPTLLAWYRAGGELALLRDRPDDALALVACGQQVAPRDPDLWHLRIEAARLKKDFETARADIARLRDLPTTPPGLADYLSARVLLAEGKLDQAVPAFERVTANRAVAAALRARAALAQAEGLASLGLPDRQQTALRQAVQLDPSLRPASLQLARLLLARGEVADARKLLDWLTRQPGPSPEALVEFARACVLDNRGLPEDRRNWREPLEALQQVEKVPGVAVEAALVRAELLLAQGQAAEAEAVLKTATEAHPKEGRLWAARVALTRRGGDRDAARQLAAEALSRVDDPTPLHLGTLQAEGATAAEANAARAALEARLPMLPAGQQVALLRALAATGPVERYARRLAEVDPPTPASLIPALELALLGREATLVEEIVAALRRYEGEESMAARFGEAAWLVRRAARGKSELLDEARPVLEAVAGQRPGWAAPYAWLGRLEDQAGRTEAATAAYRKAFDRGDRAPALALRLLDLLVQAGDLTEADRVVRQLERTQAVGGDVARLGAEIARRRGETGRARRLAEQARPAPAPRLAEAAYQLWLAAFLDRLGDPRAAVTAVQRAVDLDPANPDGWVLWVDLLVRSNNKVAAQQVLVQLTERQPVDWQAVTLAQCEALLGQPARAAVYFEQALKRDPEDIYALLQAATFYLNQKDPAQAKPLLERLRRLGPRLPEDRLRWVLERLKAEG